MMHVRRAGAHDAGAMARLINEIIAKGGTTAYVSPFSADDFRDRMSVAGSHWCVCESDGGALLGFQWFCPHPDIPETSASIATYVKLGSAGLGIGSKLFETTRSAAIDMGYLSLDAVIRADNEGGLIYYQSRGFETIKVLDGMVLEDGTRVSKIWKRLDLT